MGPYGLFLSSFISSTLFPGGSEAILIIMVKSGIYSNKILLLSSSLGNTLGGATNYFLGVLSHKINRLKSLQKDIDKNLPKLKKYGSSLLLFSWLPIIGDPLCLAAGFLKLPFYKSIVLIAIGKTLRYGVLIYISN